MIINLRGTHGSGKSTIVKTIMERYDALPIVEEGTKKPVGYFMECFAGMLYVVGPYETACGGCDAVQPYSLIWPRVEQFAHRGHVIFEGALISTTYGSIGEASKQYGDDFIFAYLNTPLEVCLDRIRKRRAAKGNNKPLDPKNTESKVKSIEATRQRVISEGQRAVTIDYRRAVPQVLGLLRKQEIENESDG